MSVLAMEEPNLVEAIRVQSARLSVLAALADLAADPLDVRRAEEMRRALSDADDVRPMLAQMRSSARRRPQLRLVSPDDQEGQR